MPSSTRGLIIVGCSFLLLQCVYADGLSPTKYSYAKCFTGQSNDSNQSTPLNRSLRCEPYTSTEISTRTHQISDSDRYLGDCITLSCRRGYTGTPRDSLIFRCQQKKKKRCEVTANDNCIAKIFWKPQTRDFKKQMLKNIMCKATTQYCLPPVDDLQIVLNNTHEHSVYNEGDSVSVRCTDGYTVNWKAQPHDRNIQCKQNGKWNIKIPKCIAINGIECNLPHRENMIQPENRIFKFGETVTLECEAKYYMVYQNYQNTLGAIKCATWEWYIPTCKEIRCPDIRPMQNGDVVYQQGNAIIDRGMGSQVTVTCYGSLTLFGSTTRTCTDGGSWDGELQRCDSGGRKSTCINPGRPISGTKVGDEYDLGDEVSFGCESGKSFSGSRVRTCLYSGEWSGMEAKCTGPNEFPSKTKLKPLMSKFVRRLSKITSCSEQNILKKHNLYGKNLLLGARNMSTVNPDMRSALGELLNAKGLLMYYILDISGSIPITEQRKSIDIIKETIKQFGITPSSRYASVHSGTEVGIVAYNQAIWKTIQPDELHSVVEYQQKLDEWMVKLQDLDAGGTNPDVAFKWVHNSIHLNKSQTVVAIVYLTDGLMTEGPDPVAELKKIKKTIKDTDRELHVFCLGVGTPSQENLEKIASEGEEYVILARNWTIQSVVLNLIKGNNVNGSDFQCGVSNVIPILKNNISDMYAIADQWQWTAALFDETQDFICGASLIGDDRIHGIRFALTAAHCVRDDKKSYKLRMGSIYLNDNDEQSDPITVDVERVFLHPHFDPASYLNDIAVLRLKTTVPFDYNINTICLPNQGSTDEIAEGHVATMTGWGYRTEDIEVNSKKLKQLKLDITSATRCNATAKDMDTSEFDIDLNFCAVGRSAFNQNWDACNKDSGSPLVVEKSKTPVDGEVSKYWEQTGIVSSGKGCDLKRPGLYTKVSSYIEWIEEQKRRTD